MGSPSSGKCTTDGVRRSPFSSASKIGNPDSIIPMRELVVPRSMPTISLTVYSTGNPAAWAICEDEIWRREAGFSTARSRQIRAIVFLNRRCPKRNILLRHRRARLKPRIIVAALVHIGQKLCTRQKCAAANSVVKRDGLLMSQKAREFLHKIRRNTLAYRWVEVAKQNKNTE